MGNSNLTGQIYCCLIFRDKAGEHAVVSDEQLDKVLAAAGKE